MNRWIAQTITTMLINLLFVALSFINFNRVSCYIFADSKPDSHQSAQNSLSTAFAKVARLWQIAEPFSKTEATNILALCRNCFAQALKKRLAADPRTVHWHTDYAQAMQIADQQGRMLLIYFCDTNQNSSHLPLAEEQGVRVSRSLCDCNRFERETLNNSAVHSKLSDYVCLKLPLDTVITVGGQKTVLLENGAFNEMLGHPGIVIIDFKSRDQKLNGSVVSTFPLTEHFQYNREQMLVILDLPPGTLTQRTLIYAVRVHPDHPASTQGRESDYLLDEARGHSQYQADILLQGHHNWETRFAKITSKLDMLSAREVCAESWPGENLLEAAVECVRCWRLSEGHWDAVNTFHPVFGYDMKRGRNGIWYATGIFGG